MAFSRTGCGSPCRAASSSMAMQAYSAFALKSIVRMALASLAVVSGEWPVVSEKPFFTDHWPLTTDHSDSRPVLVLEHVQAALLFDLAGPAAVALGVAGADRPRAGPTADARVVAVVQR